MKNKINLFIDNQEKEFYLWVDPKNFVTFNNLVIAGHASSNPIPLGTTNPEDNLLFIPNPKYKGDAISVYQNNIVRRQRAEYWLEVQRPKQYYPRMHALFLFDSIENANQYKEIHDNHIKERILAKGLSTGNYLYSIHDPGWFDFLCMEAMLYEDTVKKCVHAYWNGITITECQLQLYGNPWSQPPTMEVLFFGNLKISEASKQEINEEFKKAYRQAPWRYPHMYLT